MSGKLVPKLGIAVAESRRKAQGSIPDSYPKILTAGVYRLG